MIEEALINYGVLGIWTLSLLYEKLVTQKARKESDDKIGILVENNTVAMTKVYEVLTHCKNKQKL